MIQGHSTEVLNLSHTQYTSKGGGWVFYQHDLMSYHGKSILLGKPPTYSPRNNCSCCHY